MISELFEATDDFDYIVAMDQVTLIILNLSILILRDNCSNC